MSEPPLIDIRPDHWEIVRAILKKHVPDREVWAFGSRAKWTAKQYSDLDLCILGDAPLDLGLQANLEVAFSESDLPFKVDVVDWATTAESFRRIIERDRVVVQKGLLTGEWLNTTIGEQATLQRGFDITKAEQNIGNVPVISSGGISSHHDKPAAIGPGVILGRKGVVGSVYFIASDYWPHDTTLWVKDFHGNDRYFVYYFFKWMARRIAAMDVGSANPTLNRNHVHSIEILWPPLPEQRAIAQVLGALDDKIELNRRMNADLEAMARALFKDWFVDFGPVRAKTEGRLAYLAPEIWDIFPAALDDEDKPVGWRFGALKEVAESPRRGIQPSEVSEDTPYIGLEHMPRRSISLADWAHAGKVTSNKSVFKKGEFLFGKLRPYFHKVGIAAISGICSTDIVVVCSKGKEWGAYVLACISSDPFVNYTDQLSNGAKMPRTSWNDMGAYAVYIPGKPVAQAFENTVAPMLGQIIHNIHESQTLAQLRDLLLPKLMTGKIRVRDAEKAVARVL